MDKPKRGKLRFSRKFFLIVFCAVLAYCGVAFYRQSREMAKLNDEKKQLEEQISAANLKKEELSKLIEYASTDEYIESMAREKLGLVKQGEIRYVEK